MFLKENKLKHEEVVVLKLELTDEIMDGFDKRQVGFTAKSNKFNLHIVFATERVYQKRTKFSHDKMMYQ